MASGSSVLSVNRCRPSGFLAWHKSCIWVTKLEGAFEIFWEQSGQGNKPGPLCSLCQPKAFAPLPFVLTFWFLHILYTGQGAAPHMVSKGLQNVCLHCLDASPVSQSASAAVCYCLLASPLLLSGFASQSFFPALVSADTEKKKRKKEKKGKFNLHPYGLDSCQDTLPKKIPSVDLNYSNHVINELAVIEAALISKDPILQTQKHKL